MKFKDLAIEWIDYKKAFVKETTISTYAQILHTHILPYIGNLEGVTSSIVQDFILNKHSEKLSSRYVRDMIVVIKEVMKYGQKKGKYKYVKFELEWPTRFEGDGDGKLERLSKSESDKLKKYLIANFSFENLAILITLCTGIRIGELAALQWKDIDLDKKVLKIYKTVQRIYLPDLVTGEKSTKVVVGTAKTKSSHREIPLSSEIFKIVNPLITGGIVLLDNYISSNRDKYIEPRTFRNYHKKIFNRLGLPKIKYHGLRHTFATLCITEGVDIATVSKLLGHSDVSTTLNIYVHPSENDKKDAIQKVFG